jgi:ribonuclease P protein component
VRVSSRGASVCRTRTREVKKQYRLRKSADFDRVRDAGRSWATILLVLCVSRNELPYSRFGYAVSKRVGTAVVRNRAKRVMREVVRLRQADIRPGVDMVWIARKPIAQADYAQVERAMAQLLKQANALENLPRPDSPKDRAAE